MVPRFAPAHCVSEVNVNNQIHPDGKNTCYHFSWPHSKIFNPLKKKHKTPQNWEQNQNHMRSTLGDFHNYANKRISIKVISWAGIITPASSCSETHSQLVAIILGEHLQKCKVIHTQTHENIHRIWHRKPGPSRPCLHLMMECKVCAQWQTGVNSRRLRGKKTQHKHFHNLDLVWVTACWAFLPLLSPP